MTEPYRRKPNNRRDGWNEEIEANGQKAIATANPYEVGGEKQSELFIAGLKPGSALAFTLEDAAVIISIALQHGISPATMAKSMAREEGTGRPVSLIGAALDVVVERSKPQPKQPPKFAASEQEKAKERGRGD